MNHFASLHFALTPSLRTFVQQKAGRLFRHAAIRARLRVALEDGCECPGYGWFVAQDRLLDAGRGLSAALAANGRHKAVALLHGT